MFRRLFWLLLGACLGFGGALYLVARARHVAARLTPAGASAEIAHALRQLGADLRAAAIEGRLAMTEAEQRLRAELEPTHRAPMLRARRSDDRRALHAGR